MREPKYAPRGRLVIDVCIEERPSPQALVRDSVKRIRSYAAARMLDARPMPII
jgi:hypothetical protein